MGYVILILNMYHPESEQRFLIVILVIIVILSMLSTFAYIITFFADKKFIALHIDQVILI